MPQWWSYTFSSAVSPAYIVLADADSGDTMANRYPSKFTRNILVMAKHGSCSEIIVDFRFDAPFSGLKYFDVNNCAPTPRSCLDWLHRGDTLDGLKQIEIDGVMKNVLCDQTLNGGGWTLILSSDPGLLDSIRWNARVLERRQSFS